MQVRYYLCRYQSSMSKAVIRDWQQIRENCLERWPLQEIVLGAVGNNQLCFHVVQMLPTMTK